MGNRRFRLSDMMPNAWFYKLKDMGKARSHNNGITTDPPQSMKKKQQPTKSSAPTEATTQKQAKTKQSHQSYYPRKSYYFTRELAPSDRFYNNSPTKSKSTDTSFPDDPPRKSSKQKRNRKRTNNRSTPKLVSSSSSVSAGCSCRATIWTKAESLPDNSSSTLDNNSSPEPEQFEENCYRSDRVLFTESFDNMVAWSSSSYGCKTNSDNIAKDIVVDEAKESSVKTFDKLDGFQSLSDLELPPIITKLSKLDEDMEGSHELTEYRRSSAKFQESHSHSSLSVKVVKEENVFNKEHKSSPLRKCSVNSPGLRLRMKMNSPRIANRKIQAHVRRSTSSSNSSSSSRRSNLSDSFAIVKSSFDPQRDFKESMVEMIAEYNISASKDLEDLLACYLSLNSDEYHELIIKVFKQIWFDLTAIKLKP